MLSTMNLTERAVRLVGVAPCEACNMLTQSHMAILPTFVCMGYASVWWDTKRKHKNANTVCSITRVWCFVVVDKLSDYI